MGDPALTTPPDTGATEAMSESTAAAELPTLEKARRKLNEVGVYSVGQTELQLATSLRLLIDHLDEQAARPEHAPSPVGLGGESREKLEQMRKLWDACAHWRDAYKPLAAESIYQMDRVNLSLPELGTAVCNVIGYSTFEDDDGE